MTPLVLLLLGLLATPLQAQDSSVHRPEVGLPPAFVLDHLKEAAAARAAGGAVSERPSGAGRYLVAVVVCAGADFDVEARLGIPRRAALVLSSPGPMLRDEELRMIEWVQDEHAVSLCLVVTHEECAMLRYPTQPTASPRGQLRSMERLLQARKTATTRKVSVATAHAVRTTRELFAASPRLRTARDSGRFRAASLVLPAIRRGHAHPGSPEPTWIAPWRARPEVPAPPEGK